MGFGWHPYNMKWKINQMFETTNIYAVNIWHVSHIWNEKNIMEHLETTSLIEKWRVKIGD
jgi:hypothetical protein